MGRQQRHTEDRIRSIQRTARKEIAELRREGADELEIDLSRQQLSRVGNRDFVVNGRRIVGPGVVRFNNQILALAADSDRSVLDRLSILGAYSRHADRLDPVNLATIVLQVRNLSYEAILRNENGTASGPQREIAVAAKKILGDFFVPAVERLEDFGARELANVLMAMTSARMVQSGLFARLCEVFPAKLGEANSSDIAWFVRALSRAESCEEAGRLDFGQRNALWRLILNPLLEPGSHISEEQLADVCISLAECANPKPPRYPAIFHRTAVALTEMDPQERAQPQNLAAIGNYVLACGKGRHDRRNLREGLVRAALNHPAELSVVDLVNLCYGLARLNAPDRRAFRIIQQQLVDRAPDRSRSFSLAASLWAFAYLGDRELFDPLWYHYKPELSTQRFSRSEGGLVRQAAELMRRTAELRAVTALNMEEQDGYVFQPINSAPQEQIGLALQRLYPGVRSEVQLHGFHLDFLLEPNLAIEVDGPRYHMINGDRMSRPDGPTVVKDRILKSHDLRVMHLLLPNIGLRFDDAWLHAAVEQFRRQPIDRRHVQLVPMPGGQREVDGDQAST
ncbi:MAG: hypothetical protein K1X83_04435 [Oligoflexia bacterium]|nr:hypothetical protein [Oligoflexia bacterium]